MHSLRLFTFSVLFLSYTCVIIYALKEQELNVDETNSKYKLNVSEDALLFYTNTKLLKDKCWNLIASVRPYTFFTFIDEACVKCLIIPVALLFEETFVNLKVVI